MKYAINREQIVKTVLRGHGSVGNDHSIASFQRFFNTDLPQRHYDPDKARYHLKKSGRADDVFQLHTSGAAGSGVTDLCLLYKEKAAKAGVKIKVVQQPSDGYWSDVWRNKNWCATYWSGRATEDWMLTEVYACGSNYNDTYYCDKHFDEILGKARAELNVEKRRQMYAELQQMLRDEGGALIPIFMNHVEASSERLQYENRVMVK